MDRDLWAEIIGLGLGLGGIVLFFVIVDAVEAFQEPDELTALDRAVADWMAAHVPDSVSALGLFLAHAGSGVVVGVLVLVAAAYSWRRGHRLEAVSVAGGAMLLQGIVASLKWGFGRARPDVGLVVEPGLSFPSGHAAFGAYLGAVLVWYAVRHPWGGRTTFALVTVAGTWASLQAMGRVVIRVHYLSDVLAGLGVGFAVGGLGLAAAPFASRIAVRVRAFRAIHVREREARQP